MNSSYLSISLYTVLVIMVLSCVTTRQLDHYTFIEQDLYPISQDGLWGYVDSTNTIVIDYKFDTVHFFKQGLAVARIDGKYGYICPDGSWHIKPQYDKADDFYKDYAQVKLGSTTKSITRNNVRSAAIGHIIQGGCLPPAFAAKKEEHSIQRNGKYAIIHDYYTRRADDPSQVIIGKDTTEFLFDQVIPFGHHHILVKKENKYGLHSVIGTSCRVEKVREDLEVMEMDYGAHLDTLYLQYDDLHLEYQTFAGLEEGIYEVSWTPFRSGTEWGIITSKGKILQTPEFHSIKITSWSMALVEYEPDKYGYYNFHKGVRHFPE